MTQTSVVKFSLRKNDLVQVISGREKGKTGRILSLDPVNGRVTVEKTNMVKRHVKPSQKHPQGGVIEKELALHASKVQLMCPKCNRGVRHGHKLVEKASKKKGEDKQQVKVRVCKRCGETLNAA